MAFFATNNFVLAQGGVSWRRPSLPVGSLLQGNTIVDGEISIGLGYEYEYLTDPLYGTRSIPNINLEFFKVELDNIRGQTADEPPQSFMGAVHIGYEKGKTTIQTELNEKKEIIRNQIAKYFGRKSAIELTTKQWDRLEDEIQSLLNNAIMRSGLIQKVLIHELQVF